MIKKEEINRLYKVFFLPKNADKVNRLKNILTHMFGEKEGAALYLVYLDKKKQFQERILNKKTFQFSHLNSNIQIAEKNDVTNLITKSLKLKEDLAIDREKEEEAKRGK